jgi:hypothetical protein
LEMLDKGLTELLRNTTSGTGRLQFGFSHLY